jgi:hypothetical protein
MLWIVSIACHEAVALGRAVWRHPIAHQNLAGARVQGGRVAGRTDARARADDQRPTTATSTSASTVGDAGQGTLLVDWRATDPGPRVGTVGGGGSGG